MILKSPNNSWCSQIKIYIKTINRPIQRTKLPKVHWPFEHCQKDYEKIIFYFRTSNQFEFNSDHVETTSKMPSMSNFLMSDNFFDVIAPCLTCLKTKIPTGDKTCHWRFNFLLEDLVCVALSYVLNPGWTSDLSKTRKR